MIFEGIPEKEPGNNFNGYTGRTGDITSVGGYYKSAANCTAFINFSGTTCANPGLNAWHNGMNNYLFNDGHVKAYKPFQEGFVPSVGNSGRMYVNHCRGNSAPCP